MHPKYRLPCVQLLVRVNKPEYLDDPVFGTGAQLSILKGYRFKKPSGYTSGLGFSTDWIWVEDTNATSENVSGSGFRNTNTKNRRWRTRAWTFVNLLPESYIRLDRFWFWRSCRNYRSGNQWELSLNYPSRWSTSDWYPEQPNSIFHSRGGWLVESDTNTACPRVLSSMTLTIVWREQGLWSLILRANPGGASVQAQDW